MLQPGDIAPDFTATTTTGATISLHDYHARNNVVLYFYPKDDTPGCTTEACEFRDAKPRYDESGAVVLGVSTDDQASHQAFTDRYGLNFPLIVDSDGEICDLYGVPRHGSAASRVTFLIDTSGVIRRVWEQVRPQGHAADVLREMKSLGHS